MWLFVGPHWNIEKLRRKLMFLRFCGTRCRDNKGGWVLILFPTHPTYQNPININFRPLLYKVSWIFGCSVFPLLKVHFRLFSVSELMFMGFLNFRLFLKWIRIARQRYLLEIWSLEQNTQDFWPEAFDSFPSWGWLEHNACDVSLKPCPQSLFLSFFKTFSFIGKLCELFKKSATESTPVNYW